MKIAICYSGQIRCTRMMVNNHINLLFQPLLNSGYKIDIYIYTDNINTARIPISQDTFEWRKTDLDVKIINNWVDKLQNYCNNIEYEINSDIGYKQNNYLENLCSQMGKFKNVLEIVNNKNKLYDWIIRLRPDVYFSFPIDIKNFTKNNLYQNRECKHNYNGDSIQIFHFDNLNNIIMNIDNTIIDLQNQILNNECNKMYYEDLINICFTNAGLNLIWIDDLTNRWILMSSNYFPYINLKYLNDWTSLEYKYNFDINLMQMLVNIRQQNNNILEFNDSLMKNYDIPIDICLNKLYLTALNPDIIDISYEYVSKIKYNYNNHKNIIGLIPCSGNATRMNGIPKFLLPCKEGNLINNTINLFKKNNIDDIYISISKENEHFIKPINESNNDVKYIVKNTKTMSETVSNLVNINAEKYILIMPDTYFISKNNYKFPELAQLNIMLNKFDIVVILWKIKEYQYGKLGQVNVNSEKVIDIMDKNPECRYPYSWGVIGWVNRVNYLIDINTPHIGYIINSALEKNINVGYIISSTENYYDCGTPDEYFQMIKDNY